MMQFEFDTFTLIFGRYGTKSVLDFPPLYYFTIYVGDHIETRNLLELKQGFSFKLSQPFYPIGYNTRNSDDFLARVCSL